MYTLIAFIELRTACSFSQMVKRCTLYVSWNLSKLEILWLWKWGNQEVNGASLKPWSMHRQTQTTRCGTPWRICSAITLWCSVCKRLHWKNNAIDSQLSAASSHVTWLRQSCVETRRLIKKGGDLSISLSASLANWTRSVSGAPVTGTLTNEASPWRETPLPETLLCAVLSQIPGRHFKWSSLSLAVRGSTLAHHRGTNLFIMRWSTASFQKVKRWHLNSGDVTISNVLGQINLRKIVEFEESVVRHEIDDVLTALYLIDP